MNTNRLSLNFVADALGLDFVNAIEPPPHVRLDAVVTGEDLMAWLIGADLASTEALEDIRAAAVPGELDAAATQAALLGKWFRDFVYRYRGRPLPATAIDELQSLNRLLERDSRFGQISARRIMGGKRTPSGLALRTQRPFRTPESLLLPIAQVMADLVCTEDFTHIRECAGHGCTILFLDRTRARARRWCSMAICGNRAKQAARQATRASLERSRYKVSAARSVPNG